MAGLASMILLCNTTSHSHAVASAVVSRLCQAVCSRDSLDDRPMIENGQTFAYGTSSSYMRCRGTLSVPLKFRSCSGSLELANIYLLPSTMSVMAWSSRFTNTLFTERKMTCLVHAVPTVEVRPICTHTHDQPVLLVFIPGRWTAWVES